MRGYMLRKALPALCVMGLTVGLFVQFGWKMVYFPEPLGPVIAELAAIVVIAGYAIFQILRR